MDVNVPVGTREAVVAKIEKPRIYDSEPVTLVFFFSSRRRHTSFDCDWSSDVCSSDLGNGGHGAGDATAARAVSPDGPVRSRCVRSEIRAALPQARRRAGGVVGGAARSRGEAARPAGVAAVGDRSRPRATPVAYPRPPHPRQKAPERTRGLVLSHPPEQTRDPP